MTAILASNIDEVLLKEYKSSGNQDLLAKLYLKYSHLVYGTALKYFKDQEVAKDTVMDIYQELIEKLQKNEVNNFKSWLYTVTKNHCLMQLRKDKKIKMVDFDTIDMQFLQNEHLNYSPEKENDLIKLEKCIENLNTDQQETIRMFYLQNKCYNEITEITNFDWNKVRSLIQNGRRNLKNCMEKND